MQKRVIISFYTLLVSSIFTLTVASAATIALPATDQTTCYHERGADMACVGSGQDGEKLRGVVAPTTRFTDNGNGTVTDNLTGLIWLKNANCFNTKTWTDALTSANTLASGACGLTDASTAGQWRVPNINELASLVDISRASPALPDGHPFSSVQSDVYWSSSSDVTNANVAWNVYMNNGFVNYIDKSVNRYVWPVRAGQ